MRRQRIQQTTEVDDFNIKPSTYQVFDDADINNEMDSFLQMERLSGAKPRFENTIEAKVQPGDTLQALALRFHCKVADIKRLNKIDKENEIFARKVVKIPVNEHSILLETLPTIHKSGNSSPKQTVPVNDEFTTKNICNPLEDAQKTLGEKLLVASVNAAGIRSNINNNDTLPRSTDNNEATAPLIDGFLDDEYIPRLRPIRGPSLRTIDWSGSDCDMSWVCLFVVILALCFVIPLIYVIYIAEHTHHHNVTSSH
ncbi:lysM and putative peptidoglycan-binding domain-containing protein 3 isoform X2 [Teleopsis dalmanni]|uniref:lysM and putative peptidoglycan-binding domain-containing protein 3 isoform X2 n=1 Tax=Teleopsis dalmanni TaxID=139649 RepID=UPI0018CD5739|nr:lysM and putative peptidoglycan-binding domain-containing protein 3 isoform X2 [Teleopsis dalmanni]